MSELKFYKCAKCGEVVYQVAKGSCTPQCCGEPMVELTANTTDAATEKHVPVVTVNGAAVHVQVGEVEHPMTEEHLISFIVLVTEKGYQVAELTAADKPAADFAVAEGDKPVKVYEYCNLHGLWVKEL